MGRFNTNMASEFWFYSQLHRLGYQTYITLGNTKSIDIIVRLANRILTFDVKGKETFKSGEYQYLPKTKGNKNHYYVFIGLQVKREKEKVRFDGEIECYIINSFQLDTIAFNWVSNDNKTKGYGLDPKILRILKKYNNENDKMTIPEKRTLDSFKKVKKYRHINIKKLKRLIMNIDEFEDKFFSKKQIKS